MAERTNSELFTKNSLKLQTSVFTIQSDIQYDTRNIEATTASVPMLGEDIEIYKGSTAQTYDFKVKRVQTTPMKPFGE
jgi:hypothetical protein